MGVQLWLQGRHRERVRKQIGDGRIGVVHHGSLITVWRSEVAEWCDDWLMSVVDLWWRWRTFSCLPFAGGWAEQPSHIMEAIEVAESASKVHESEQRRQQERSH